MNKKIKKECKHFHQEPFWTPNNYDLFFDYNSIPANIEVENNHDLIRRLKKHLPLSKILHINIEDNSINYTEQVNIYTKTKISFKRIDGEEVVDVVVNLK